AAPYGLRDFFAVTTDRRPYWDALPRGTLADGDDPAIPFAREGYRRSQLEPVRSALHDALEQTARLAAVVQLVNLPDDLHSVSLWRTARRRHPTGLLMSAEPRGTCGDCVWAY